jgi:alcohol dehydrogenase class IV
VSVPRFQHVTPELRTFCGAEALDALPRQLDRLGLRRAVVFCGQSLPRLHSQALARVESALGDQLAATFDRVESHSPVASVEAAAAVLLETDADAVVAVGGGSAVVTARAASIVLAEQRDVRELATRREADGRLVSPKLLAGKLAQWIVPTTPTTAYAKAGAAVRDPATGDRLALYDPKVRAHGIFIDPELALTAPVTLAQGAALNAFSMAVEGLQSKVDDPLADALLAHALEILFEWLPRLVASPDDPEPRVRLMLAALLCGQGSDYVGGGLAQALSHAAGPRSSTSNGVVEALLLPHAMRYNAPVTGKRLRRVAAIVGGEPASDTSSLESAAVGVQSLLRVVDVPSRLRDVGVVESSLAEIVEHALNDWTLTQVPRTANRGDIEELLHAAW